MRISTRLQLLTCLMLCASSAQSIMVKYGTKDGPIEPPAPEPLMPLPRATRAPAPVWEERSNDSPDPNSHWRPQFFIPQPRYTQIMYKNLAPAPLPINNAQRFVSSYIPIDRKPIYSPPITDYLTPSQFLSSQTLPGYGLRYFAPHYVNNDKHLSKHEDAKQNHIEGDNVDVSTSESASDLQWKYEKDATKRITRNTKILAVPAYSWQGYVLPRYR